MAGIEAVSAVGISVEKVGGPSGAAPVGSQETQLGPASPTR